jgi:hypothetical protein
MAFLSSKAKPIHIVGDGSALVKQGSAEEKLTPRIGVDSQGCHGLLLGELREVGMPNHGQRTRP